MNDEVQTEVQTDAPVAEEVTAEVDAKPEAEVSEEKVNQEESPSESSPEKKKGVQRRIDELTRNRYEAERERDYWRQQVLNNQPSEPEPEKPTTPKTLEDFDFDEIAYQKHVNEQAAQIAKDAARREIEQANQQSAKRQRQADFGRKEADFAKEHDDYMEVTRSDFLSINHDMVEILQEIDKGPEVLYYLGNNPDVADKISMLPPIHAAREIGRIEAQLAAKPKESVTKAPPPPPKVEASDATVPKSISDEMTQKQWNDYRRKQIANRRR